MKNLKLLMLVLVAGYLLPFFNLKPSYAKNLDIGISINDRRISDFYFHLGDYYHVPVEKIIIIKKRYPFILDEELPVVFLIYRDCGIEPDVILHMRKKGYSWYSIMLHFGLYPERIFREYIIVPGPPYGKAWGYYKPYKGSKIILFNDRDIIEFTNKKFLKEYYNKK